MKIVKWIASCGAVGVLSMAALSWFGASNSAVQAQNLVGKTSAITAKDCAIALIDSALLAADRPGVLDFLDLEDGDEVQANQKVAGLKDGVARSALATATEKARNDVQERYADKATQFANKELEIAKDANAKLPGTVPLLEVQKLVLAAERGVLQVEQAQVERAIAILSKSEAEENLKTYEVLAPPYDCKVSKVLKKKGEAVRQGDPIIEVVSTARMKIEGYVTPSESYVIKPGDTVLVQLKEPSEYSSMKFPGVVKYVDERVVGGKQVMVTAYVKNNKGILKDGLPAIMTIQITK